MRMLKLIPVAIVVVLGGYCGTAMAHHSTAMFDRAQKVTLTGTVKEFQWTNPHTWIQLEVANAAGGVDEWSIEGNSPNQLIRLGWRPAILKPGDSVTVIVNPMKDGARGALFIGLKMADGKTLGEFAP